jgi:hypothetical protein
MKWERGIDLEAVEVGRGEDGSFLPDHVRVLVPVHVGEWGIRQNEE